MNRETSFGELNVGAAFWAIDRQLYIKVSARKAKNFNTEEVVTLHSGAAVRKADV